VTVRRMVESSEARDAPLSVEETTASTVDVKEVEEDSDVEAEIKFPLTEE
jgi:hypothetical protein